MLDSLSWESLGLRHPFERGSASDLGIRHRKHARRFEAGPRSRPIPLAYVASAIEGDWLGFGVSDQRRVAQTRARCEAVERFALFHPEATRARALHGSASLERAPGLMFEYFRTVAPAEGAGALRDRFRVARCVADPHVRRLVPVEWIYIGSSPAANTNGSAFGKTLAAAIDSARRELIERDLLLRAWYGLARSRELTARERSSPVLARWHAAARENGLAARWFLLGRPGALVTVVCVLGGTAPPHFGSGSSTGPSLVRAAEKAFFEAAGSHAAHVEAARRAGPGRFVRRSLARAAGDPAKFRLLTFEAFWAARMPRAMTEVCARFNRPRLPAPPSLRLRRFLFVDVTPEHFRGGRVVKVFHEGAVPLPNRMAQVIALERLLGVGGDGTPPPIS
jgi:hypothetical protein